MDNSHLHSMELKRQLNKQNDMFSAILDELHNSGVPGALEAKNLLSQTPSSLRSKQIEELLQIFLKDYQLPCYTLEEFHLLVQQHRKLEHTRHANKELDKNRAQYSESLRQDAARIITVDTADQSPGSSFLHQPSTMESAIPPTLASTETLPFELSKYTIHLNKVIKAICPTTLQLYPRPIQFIYPVLLSDFDDLTSKFPMTDIVDIYTSLHKYLARAQEYGFSKKQVGILTQRFIETYFKEFSFVIAAMDTPEDIFRAVVNLINTHDVVSTCNQNLETLVRQPGQPISSTFMSVKSLLLLRFKYSETHLSLQQIETKAENVAKATIKYYLSDPCKNAYFQWIQERKSYGDTPSISEILSFISDIESKDSTYKLTEPRAASGFTQKIDVDLFKTQTEHNMTRSHTKKFPNFKFLKSPKDRKSRSDYRTSTPIRGSSANRTSTPKFGSRSPSAESRSPSHDGRRSASLPRTSLTPSPSRYHQNHGAKPKQSYNKSKQNGSSKYNKNNTKHNHQSRYTNRSQSKESNHSNKSSANSSRSNSPGKFLQLQDDFLKLQKRFETLLPVCKRCGSTSHKSKDCVLYKREAPTRCSCGWWHYQDKCVLLTKN